MACCLCNPTYDKSDQVSPNTTELVSMEGGAGELLPLDPPRLDHCSIQVLYPLSEDFKKLGKCCPNW